MARRLPVPPRIPGLLILVGFAVLVAAMALPYGSRHVAASSLDDVHLALARLRAAVRGYANDHEEWPGQLGGWQLRAQLLGTTDAAGHFGEIPLNPAGGGRVVAVVDRMPERPTDAAAWIYCRLTGELRPDTTAEAADGRPFFDL